MARKTTRLTATAPTGTDETASSVRSSPWIAHGWRPASRSSQPPAEGHEGQSRGERSDAEHESPEPVAVQSDHRPTEHEEPGAEERHQRQPAAQHQPQAPVQQRHHGHVVPGPVDLLVLPLQIVDAPHRRVEREVVQQREQPGDLHVDRRFAGVGAQRPDREDRQRSGGGRLVERLGGGHLHRLVVDGAHALEVPGREANGARREADDAGLARRAAERLRLVPPPDLPRRDREHEHRAGHERREHDVRDGQGDVDVQEDRPQIGGDRAAIDDLVAARVLHPCVDGEDGVGRHHGRRTDDPEEREVQSWRDAPPPEHPEPEEHRLDEERGEALQREGRAEDVAHVAGVRRPVHPELEGLQQAGDDADREADQHRSGVVAREAEVLLIARAHPAGLHERHLEGEADGRRDHRVVDQRGEGELDSREVEGRRE